MLNGRQVPPPSPNDPSEHEPPLIHAREVGTSRGLVPASNKASASKPTSTVSMVQRSQTSNTSLRSPVVGGPPERRPSQNHGHLRHASKAASQFRNDAHPASPNMKSVSPESATSLMENTAGSGDFETLSRWPLHRPASKSPANSQQRPPQHSAASSMTLVEKDIMDPAAGATQRKVDRPQISKPRNEHSHHRSNSRHYQEQKTVGEYSLHHLFNKFLPQADFKIRQCILEQGPRHDISIEFICGPGADPDFDNLIYAMAHITRRKPKPLVDTIMYWRQQRARGSNEPFYDMSSPSSHQTVSRRIAVDDIKLPTADHNQEGMSYEDSAYNSEYRVFVAIYLTCRVLIQVFNQAEASALSSSMQQKLESIIFERLQSLDPGMFIEQSFKRAIWEIYARLLGVMSSRVPSSVSTLFINDLTISQKELSTMSRTAPLRDVEVRLEMLIRAVRYVHVKTSPESAWRESCNFLFAFGDLLVNSHGAPLKYAYCNAFVDLLLPVASNWSSSLNTSKYREFHAIILPRITSIVAKPRHWSEALPFYSVLLCASPDDQFSNTWPLTLNGLQTKLKDRSTRAVALQAITRMVWTFLERVREVGTAIRRLEEIMKTVFPSSKKTSFSIDTVACEPLIELIRIIGYHNQEYCFSKIIFPLLNSDLFASGKDIKVEQLDPERMVVGIRAFLLIMTDLENGDSGKPPFPRFGSGGANSETAQTTTGVSGASAANLIGASVNLKPFASSRFGSSVRDYYTRFCEILGKITIVCDNAFGGQAVLDEKFGAVFTPKTPLVDTFTFARRADDHQGPTEQRLGFYELLHVAVQALPRSLSAHVQLKPLINLLCTCTAHVQSNIAVSSIQSLKSIARQSYAQNVTIGFARFIFNFDARYSTMSEEGLLGPDHIENTLSLYVDLLLIWIEEIKQKMRGAGVGPYNEATTGSRSRQLDLASVSNHVDEVESHGLFFLCSQSRRVRAFAVRVLKIVTEFDTALGRQSREQRIPRIIHIMEGDSQDVMDVNDESLSVAERSRLQKGRHKSSSQPTLIELSSSDVSYDSTLWFKVFPNIIRLSFERCIAVVMLGREIVCARLMQMQETITFLDSGMPPLPLSDANGVRTPHRIHSMSPQVLIEQWKLYLIMACTTVTNTGGQTQSQLDKSQHARKISKPAPPWQDKISSARALFAYVIPLLSASSSAIREAIVVALSSINTNLFRVLLESLQYAVTSCKDETKKKVGPHHRSGSNPRKSASTDRMRAEVAQIYRLTARFLQDPTILQDDWIITNLSTYARELMIFLGDSEVQNDWDSQKLRRQFCGLLEELANGLNRITDPFRYMSFESRRSAFALMEEWCGYFPIPKKPNQKDHPTPSIANQRFPDAREKHITASIEHEKRDLSVAALSAMAALCAGPMRVTTDKGEALSFDSRRMLLWIDQLFASDVDKLHIIGQRALYNLVSHNRSSTSLVEWSIEQCFNPARPRALQSHFSVLNKVLNAYEDYRVPFWRVLAALLFLLGNEKNEIRVQSAELLQTLERRREQNSGIQDFDINISDRTTAVYKLAAYEISARLSQTHQEYAFHIFSLFCNHFRNVQEDIQRQMVFSILPWVQVIELQVDTNVKPTAQSAMVLANLLEITFKSSGVLHNEVQALWQALATGHPGNVQLVLDFVISLCSDRKDQAVVYYAKQIIVYMAHGTAGAKVVEFLLLKITPKNMVFPQKEALLFPDDSAGLPYSADLAEILPNVNKTESFALGHLAVVFLVDLIVKPMTVKAEQVPLLLHVIFVLWDNQVSLVQDQARELLVHLVHELVITKLPAASHDLYASKKTQVESFVDAVRHHDSSVVWQYRERAAKYEEWATENDAESDVRVPTSMPQVTGQVLDIFAIIYPDIRDRLARISLNWGTSCPVRHAACRSLQVFRCVLVPIDRAMLSDILARISNTIVHEAGDVQAFSMEMLTTVKCIIAAMGPVELLRFPHLFWASCACLGTVIEKEFMAALGMLDKVLPKLNLDDPAVIKILEGSKPAKWQGLFEGLTPLVYKGLKSEASLDTSLKILDLLVVLPKNDLIGNQPHLLFVTLAHLPCFLQSYKDGTGTFNCLHSAEKLAAVAESEDRPMISQVLNDFRKGGVQDGEEFLTKILGSLRDAYFPMWEMRVLIFVIGLLTNKLHWYKMQALEIVRVLITHVDTHRSEISEYGPDLISPLLRLLQTDFCPQAIAVLDHITVMSDTPLTKQHMRMSMTGLGSRSLHVRKEYERTQSLYGIPEETGWSVPMPAVHAGTTRANMQLIYQECANPSVPATEAEPTPEIEFHPEEEHDPSYFGLDRSDTMITQETIVETSTEGGVNDLLTKLNSLDDFFDESLDAEHEGADRYSNLTVTPYYSDPDARAEIYDQETAPILQRSLARTASISSIHGHLTERPKPAIMNPTAFTSPSASGNPAARPALHSRSVTSPANNLSRVNNNAPSLLSDDEGDDAILSEDERSTGHNAANTSRLLGSTSLRKANIDGRKNPIEIETRDARKHNLSRAQSRSQGRSPVPKVPEAYTRR